MISAQCVLPTSGPQTTINGSHVSESSNTARVVERFVTRCPKQSFTVQSTVMDLMKHHFHIRTTQHSIESSQFIPKPTSTKSNCPAQYDVAISRASPANHILTILADLRQLLANRWLRRLLTVVPVARLQ